MWKAQEQDYHHGGLEMFGCVPQIGVPRAHQTIAYLDTLSFHPKSRIHLGPPKNQTLHGCFFLSTIKESELLKRSKRGGLAQDDVECPTNARGWIVWDGMAWNTSYTLHVTASWAVERCAGWPCLQGLNYQSYRAKHGGHYLA